MGDQDVVIDLFLTTHHKVSGSTPDGCANSKSSTYADPTTRKRRFSPDRILANGGGPAKLPGGHCHMTDSVDAKKLGRAVEDLANTIETPPGGLS
jgi:hypothetical protein